MTEILNFYDYLSKVMSLLCHKTLTLMTHKFNTASLLSSLNTFWGCIMKRTNLYQAILSITALSTILGALAQNAAVLDLLSRRILGWAMDKHIGRHLVINALLMAIWQRQQKDEVLVHGDQGSQYASADYLAFMKEHNLIPSMSRRGSCYDNKVELAGSESPQDLKPDEFLLAADKSDSSAPT